LTSENSYLCRAPLLDAEQRVSGYTLAFQKNGPDSESTDEAASRQLLSQLAARAGETRSSPYFLKASPAVLLDRELASLSGHGTVLMLKQNDLLNADGSALAASLRERGFGLALCDVDLEFLNSKQSEPLLSQVNHIVVDFVHPQRAAISYFARQRQPTLGVVVDRVPGWEELDACVGAGVSSVFANLCLAPREVKQTVKLGPQALQILQLMHMVQGNADIRHLEKVLKSDVALSYKLLRYINSAGFGLEVEIESPRHAVAMLGYAPMFRWLLLLLARTHTTGFSPALMQAAMVRGRFAELLGQGFLTRREAENLFVVGMFSFLDRLLGSPIKEVLDQLVLPEAVAEALLERKGVYAPVLVLAEACEGDDRSAADFAQALSMKAEHVNQAHLSALAWAQNIKI
jgi:c-di-GMP-related signal transduction protein